MQSPRAPRRTRAMAALCEELTATEILYPGTNLTLVYSVMEGRCLAGTFPLRQEVWIRE